MFLASSFTLFRRIAERIEELTEDEEAALESIRRQLEHWSHRLTDRREFMDRALQVVQSYRGRLRDPLYYQIMKSFSDHEGSI
jgi:dsDNA-specific endonuclease/ATPase MutS2